MTATHISAVRDGSIVNFPNLIDEYMKVCNGSNGVGGVVNLRTGNYIPVSKFAERGIGVKCYVVYDNLEKLIQGRINEDEDEDIYACEMESLGSNWY